ncbi:ATP-binding cassette domain-containing protein [Ponticoccus sp. SC2-23]|uniref:ATP-binding cassette domain-containing protein n=1 Tax=Alexandriicola marinus TaxID=2081710 RepID=UPI000FDC592D|nr:ATP-binding cassette domain-containing protein [Alexandriicola marinus]MBM1218649.1 ATP-binding cassette domain-containing protein [Ponticoccus sp. SC6-9]MBM1224279.1 ATP-binding cassette domain-containing protein [Ponticoccus sp. SC6-15]MBM1229942.1 ATP-binding cassette domain-containing protein [Ponticoccus sp. SC6-38]MBM1233245.1 ATP-binding cassette domain-containing protein [Ponticoccus sp. SC6-45]MBM1236805.1 ATP-binding cassette domain-containing protein [Ponticoccus sp. SC6-49]MBM1
MSGPVLDLSDVRKSYGKSRALDSISLAMNEGEFVGLLGPNGAGKSTLFQIVAGLFAPDGGTVRLFGLDHASNGPRILARLGVVFQVRSVDLDISVHANLRFHGRLFGLSGDDLARRIAELCAQFNLDDLLTRPVRTLSGGQQRRVEIARALINHPDLLIMDEPSAGLDASSRRDLVAHVRALARTERVAVLWATHLVDEVGDADRIVILDQGKIRADDTPAALLAATGAADLTDVYERILHRRLADEDRV